MWGNFLSLEKDVLGILHNYMLKMFQHFFLKNIPFSHAFQVFLCYKSFATFKACYSTWCHMNFSKLNTVFNILCMLWHLMFMNFWKLNIFLKFSTWTASRGFVRWPFQCTSSLHSLQVKYSDHFSVHSVHVLSLSFLKISLFSC